MPMKRHRGQVQNGGRKGGKAGMIGGWEAWRRKDGKVMRLGSQEAGKKVGDVHKYINNCKD
jgi:hypothetical protein